VTERAEGAAAVGAALRPAGEADVLRHMIQSHGTPPPVTPSARGEALRLATSVDRMVDAMGLRPQVRACVCVYVRRQEKHTTSAYFLRPSYSDRGGGGLC